MNVTRRRLLAAGLAGAAGAAVFGAWRAWPDEGFFNPCLGALPPELANHAIVRDAWAGLDAAQVMDMHVHLLGVGDAITSLPHADGVSDAFGKATGFDNADGTLRWPVAQAQRAFFLNAACINAPGIDTAYAARLRTLVESFPAGANINSNAAVGVSKDALDSTIPPQKRGIRYGRQRRCRAN